MTRAYIHDSSGGGSQYRRVGTVQEYTRMYPKVSGMSW